MNDVNSDPDESHVEWHVVDIAIAMTIPGVALFLSGIFLDQQPDPRTLIVAPGMILASFWTIFYFPSVVSIAFPVLGAATSVVLFGLAVAKVSRLFRISAALTVVLAFLGITNLVANLFPLVPHAH